MFEKSRPIPEYPVFENTFPAALFINIEYIFALCNWKTIEKQADGMLKIILDICISVLYDTHDLNNDSFSLIQSGGGT